MSYTRNRVRTLVQLAKQKLILTNVNHGEFVFQMDESSSETEDVNGK